MRKIIVDQEIFEKFPDFNRGIVIATNINNATGNKRIKKRLNKEIEDKAGKDYVEHEFVKAWDEVHSRFGSNPNKFPPSIKSLLKRIDKGGGFPFINSVVALFNYISIKYLIPCGGDDVDQIQGSLRLGLAKGNEAFVPLGEAEQETPEPGEVVYFDDESLNVMCRRWNWRNGDFAKIAEETNKVVINIDGIGPVPQSLVEEARDELAQLLVEQCNASVTTDLLNKDQPQIDIDL
ncbi:MAG: B3/4 domain-containing protein [Dehalococcoidia bacterium]